MRVCSLLVLVLLFCIDARGDDSRQKVRALFDSGTGHYNLSEFKEALVEFKEAYRLSRDPTFLFNIAQCLRQLDDPAAAVGFYRAYRRESPDGPNREEVDRLIGAMERRAELQARPAPGPIIAAAAPTLELAPSPASADRRPLTSKRWFWAAVGGGVVLVAAAVTIGVVFGVGPRAPSPSVGRVDGN